MMLRSILFIKSVHTVIFVFMTGALTVLFYEIIVDKITLLTWIAVALFLMEGVVLFANGWMVFFQGGVSYVHWVGPT